MERSNYDTSKPILLAHVPKDSTPRGVKVFARIVFVLILAVAIILAVALLTNIVSNYQSANATDAQALAKLENYREQDCVNLDAYLQDRQFKSVGSDGEYVYRSNGRTVMIHVMGDYVRIGDGRGNTREFGIPVSSYSILDDGSVQYDRYACRISWHEGAETKLRDIYLSREALAEIVRTSYR